MKTDLFQSCAHCRVFQICWHIECSTFTASSFRIWNSSTAIPSPPLALFVVMLSKAYLTSHSRMSGSRWVITPLWLSGSWRSFCTVLLCILGEGNGNPLQYSCLENPMDRGAWQARVHGVTKSRTRLSDFTHSLTHSVYSCHLFLISSASVSITIVQYQIQETDIDTIQSSFILYQFYMYSLCI